MTTQMEARKLTAVAFTREAVEDLSRHKGEPDWLRDARLTAWQQADTMPLPAAWERAWKYFKPEQLRVEGMDLPPLPPSLKGRGSQSAGVVPATSSPSPRMPAPARREGGGRADRRGEAPAGRRSALSITNGAVTDESLVDAARAQGVIFAGLDTAVREHPELVRKHLGSVVPPTESVYVALNAALWSGGLFVYVPRDVKVELPLQAVLTLAGLDVALFPRALIVIERGSEVAVVDEHVGGGGAAFVSSVTELVVGDEAKVQHYGVQRWGAEVQELFYQRAEVGRNAELKSVFAGLGGRVYKGWIDNRIRGTGARSDILGAVFGTESQYFDLVTTQDHIGDHTLSDLLIKSALKDRAQSAYYGMTRVGRDARMADANQEDRNLLLSDQAKAEAEPVLEILTSEVVRCAHGASAGPVDLEQLFYLECRGLPRPEAEKLLVQGFLGQVLERVPLAGVRALMEEAVAAKLT